MGHIPATQSHRQSAARLSRRLHGRARGGAPRRLARRLRGERGQAVVELGLVVPILCGLVLVFVDFGKSLNYWLDLNHVAGMGARLAAVDADVTKAPYAAAGATSLQDYLAKQLETNELQTGSSSVDPSTVAVCFPSGTAAGDPVTVQVRTSYKWLPLIGGTWTIKGKATMRLERDAVNVTASGSCS